MNEGLRFSKLASGAIVVTYGDYLGDVLIVSSGFPKASMSVHDLANSVRVSFLADQFVVGPTEEAIAFGAMQVDEAFGIVLADVPGDYSAKLAALYAAFLGAM